MQTMTALVRVAGNPLMTVKLHAVTPGEALLLMHIHDPDTKDVFEDAELSADVKRSTVEERDRLKAKYAENAKLVDQLFPGRNASDIPDRFDELLDVPLEVAAKATDAAPKRRGKKASADDLVLSDEAAKNILMTGKE